MTLETYNQPWDFQLLDTGDGYRLEKWGEAVLQRPDPQIIWPKSLKDEEWQKAWAIFSNRGNNAEAGAEKRGTDFKGAWEIKKPLPDPWIVEFKNTQFLLKLSPFKHTGLFAEQAAQWEWMVNQLQVHKVHNVENKKLSNTSDLELYNFTNFKTANKFKILNLFAYTGGATMVLAKAGCFVTHVDASKPAIAWAKENHKLNNLPADSARWILDDAVKFAQRELKRGARYDAIIMDPPAFGHSPSGKMWKFNRDLPTLLADCAQILSADAKFLILNGYATNASALAVNNLLEDAMRGRAGSIEFGELCLKHPVRNIISNGTRMISTGIFARWTV